MSRFHSLSVYSHALVRTLWGKPSLRAASILSFILSRIGLDSSLRKACRASSVKPLSRATRSTRKSWSIFSTIQSILYPMH